MAAAALLARRKNPTDAETAPSIGNADPSQPLSMEIHFAVPKRRNQGHRHAGQEQSCQAKNGLPAHNDLPFPAWRCEMPPELLRAANASGSPRGRT